MTCRKSITVTNSPRTKKVVRLQALRALDESIKHWQRAKRVIVDGINQYFDNGELCDDTNCALCTLYNGGSAEDGACLTCPLYLSEGYACDSVPGGVWGRVQLRGETKRVMLDALRRARKMVEKW